MVREKKKREKVVEMKEERERVIIMFTAGIPSNWDRTWGTIESNHDTRRDEGTTFFVGLLFFSPSFLRTKTPFHSTNLGLKRWEQVLSPRVRGVRKKGKEKEIGEKREKKERMGKLLSSSQKTKVRKVHFLFYMIKNDQQECVL